MKNGQLSWWGLRLRTRRGPRLRIGAALAALVVGTGVVARAEFIVAGSEEDKALALAARERQDLDQATECFRRRDFDGCLSRLRSAVARDAGLPPAQVLLAGLFLADGQRARAQSLLEEAAQQATDCPEVYVLFGELAAAEGRLTDAFLHFQHAEGLPMPADAGSVRRDQLQARCQLGLSLVAEQRRDWRAVETHLAAYLGRHPHDGASRQRLARACFAQGDPARAEAELRRAVGDDPTLDPAPITLAWLFTRDGNANRGRNWARAAIREAPRDPRAHFGLALWLLEQGEVEPARAAVEAGRALDPKSRDLTFLAGLIARFGQDPAQAERVFESLLRETPADLDVKNQLALVLIQGPDESRRHRALELAKQNARDRPDSREVQATLGWVRFRLGQLEAAEQALGAAVTGGAVGPDTSYHYARVLAARGHPEEARRWLAASLKARGPFADREEALRWRVELAETSREPSPTSMTAAQPPTGHSRPPRR